MIDQRSSSPSPQRPGEFPFVRSDGLADDVGRRHGEAFAEQIGGSIALYRRLFDERGLSWDQVIAAARDARDVVAEYAPDMAAEMAGIARGADVDPLAIVAINIRSGLIQRLESRRPGSGTAGSLECTAGAVLPAASRDGRTLLAQNWDQLAACQPNTVVVEQHQHGLPALLYVTEAGILFRHGLNDLGVGVAGNTLRTTEEASAAAGVPAAVARRMALRHGTLAPARAEIERAPRSHAVNHLLASAEGEAIDLETVPSRCFAVEPDRGILVHANHFTNDEACATVTDPTPTLHPSTLHRQRCMRASLDDRHGSIEISDVQRALQDHDGLSNAVCKHPSAEATVEPSMTVASSVMDLTERTLWVAVGPACEGTYVSYRFN